MVVTCVTCRYLPNLRYIARLCEVDHAVILDLAPLPHQNKNSFVSRNRFCDKLKNFFWLSVPVRRKGIKNLIDVKVDETCHNWIDKHVKNIARAYPDHKKIAGDFLSRLREVLEMSDGSLIDLNLRALELILEFLELENNIIKQSAIIKTHSKQHRIEIAKLLGATSYVAGQVEWDLMQNSGCNEKMNVAGIQVVKTPELDSSIFPKTIIRELSCVHSICTLGPVRTRILIDQIVKSLQD